MIVKLPVSFAQQGVHPKSFYELRTAGIMSLHANMLLTNYISACGIT